MGPEFRVSDQAGDAMPADMLDRLQEDKLRGLEELMDSYQAAAATNGGDDQAAALADFFIDEGIGVRQSSLRLWDYHWGLALAGKVLNRRERGGELRALLERGGQVLSRNAALARAYADRSGRPIARLTQLEDECKAFPLWVEECMARWELLDRPHKPLDRVRVAQARAAFAKGECEPAADVLARLEAGGPLERE